MPTDAEYAARFTILRAELLARYRLGDYPPADGIYTPGQAPHPAVRALQEISNVIFQYGREHAIDTEDELRELATFTAWLGEGLQPGLRNGPILAALLVVREHWL